MKSVTVSVETGASIEDAYERLAVLASHESFTAPLLVDYRPSGPARGVGARVRLTAATGGRRIPVDMTVVEDVRPSRIVEQSVSAAGRRRATGTYTLEPAPGGGTRIEFTYAPQRVPLADRLLAPVVRASMRRGLRATLARLAGELAGHASAPTDTA